MVWTGLCPAMGTSGSAGRCRIVAPQLSSDQPPEAWYRQSPYQTSSAQAQSIRITQSADSSVLLWH